jgi:hypothetical protein
MQEMQARRDLYSANDSTGFSNTNQPKELIEWETEGAIEYIKFLQEKNKK